MKKYKVMTVGALIFALSLSVSASNAVNQPTTVKAETAQKQESPVLKVEEALAKGESLKNKIVKVEGLCGHLCPHGGNKLFLKASNSKQTIRVEVSKSLGSFGKEVSQKQITITGKLLEHRVDEAFLKGWEKTLNQPKPKKEVCNSTGCSSEGKARGENVSSPATERIALLRKRIAERKAKEGKDFLSFYYLEANSYTVN